MSASWGEDDMWDVAARYAGEWNGIKVAAAAAYDENTSENLAVNVGGLLTGGVNTPLFPNIARRDVGYFQAGAYVEHVATGLWAYGAYGKERVDNIYRNANGTTFGAPDDDFWYVKAGLRERWTHLGDTVLYGEYGNHNDQMNPALIATGATGSGMRQYGAGVVQEIDAAAMSVWLSWKRYDGEVDCSAASAAAAAVNACSDFGVNHTKLDLQTLDMVKFGALINF